MCAGGKYARMCDAKRPFERTGQGRRKRCTQMSDGETVVGSFHFM